MSTNTNAYLALADGTIFHGVSRGAPLDLPGEVVFNTGMTGYQEIVSDPSYFGQIVTLSAAEIGNYGCAASDMESDGLHLSGLVVRELNPPSSWRSEESLEQLFRRSGKPLLSGVDTRRLVLHIRQHGTQKAWLHADASELPEEVAVAKAREWAGLDDIDCASQVTSKAAYDWCTEGDALVVVIDCGVKRSILRMLEKTGFRVRVVPAGSSAAEILALKPDGVLLSNGPGDPAGVTGVIDCIRALLGQVPIMGICLGHQMLALACGARTGRLPFGHHGINHPVLCLADGSVEITSQNHNFAVTQENLPSCLEVTRINLNDQTIEGLRHRSLPAFSIQYHPEAAPGPVDAARLFTEFKTLIHSSK